MQQIMRSTHQATIHGDLAKLSGCNLTRAKSNCNTATHGKVNPYWTPFRANMDYSFIFYLVAALLVIVGIAGIILPALPGVPLVFVGLLVAAWGDGFERVGWLPLVVLGVLTVISVIVDVIATVVGAQKVGASKLALLGSAIGTVVGLFFMPIGLFVGPFAGALLGEYLHGRQLGQATKVGLGTWLGIILGVALKLGLAMTMLGVFAAAWFF